MNAFSYNLVCHNNINQSRAKKINSTAVICSNMVKYSQIHMIVTQIPNILCTLFDSVALCVMALSLIRLTCSLWDWRPHLCGPVSCQLEQLQTCTAQPYSDTRYAAKNGQREADRLSRGSWSTQLSTVEGKNTEAALNWANVTFCGAWQGRREAPQRKLWLETFHYS